MVSVMRNIGHIRTWLIACAVLAGAVTVAGPAAGEENGTSDISALPRTLSLREAVMCEEVEDYAPVNKAVVFSLDIGKIYAFTTFDPVPEETGGSVRLEPGLFALFMPGDAHMPMLSPADGPTEVTKVVVKIDVDLIREGVLD